MYTRIRLLLLIRPFFFLFSFSNIQTLKIFVTLFSGTVRPGRLKLCAHVDNGWMYHVYRNQEAAAYLSLYFFIFLSNIKTFRHTFLRNCEAWKVETWCTRGQWVDVSYIPGSGGCCIFVPLFFNFLYLHFQTLNCFCHTFLRKCEA